jgi:hypothetical protein
MATQATAFHNSRPRSSGKSRLSPPRSLALKLAADLAREVGMVPTWPNVQTIRLAIEAEAAYSEVSVSQAAALIVAAALNFMVFDASNYSWQAATLLRKSNIVNRFWFEDALWRHKYVYNDMLVRLQKAKADGISIDELEIREREESERQAREAVQWIHDRTKRAEAH